MELHRDRCVHGTGRGDELDMIIYSLLFVLATQNSLLQLFTIKYKWNVVGFYIYKCFRLFYSLILFIIDMLSIMFIIILIISMTLTFFFYNLNYYFKICTIYYTYLQGTHL